MDTQIEKPFAEHQSTLTENAVDPAAPAPRDRSSSDSPKPTLDCKHGTPGKYDGPVFSCSPSSSSLPDTRRSEQILSIENNSRTHRETRCTIMSEDTIQQPHHAPLTLTITLTFLPTPMIETIGHSEYMSPRMRSLLLWENPRLSGGVLAGSLTAVLLCRWVSLLNLVSALFVFGISASFVYVNGLTFFNRVTNKPAVRPLE
jgi:hypothetical protein